MPVARYFIFVGGALTALLFIAGWCLPTPQAIFVDQPAARDRAIIRIKSARKWPEKVVLDTSPPMIALEPSRIAHPRSCRTKRLVFVLQVKSHLPTCTCWRCAAMPDSTNAACRTTELGLDTGTTRGAYGAPGH